MPLREKSCNLKTDLPTKTCSFSPLTPPTQSMQIVLHDYLSSKANEQGQLFRPRNDRSLREKFARQRSQATTNKAEALHELCL